MNIKENFRNVEVKMEETLNVDQSLENYKCIEENIENDFNTSASSDMAEEVSHALISFDSSDASIGALIDNSLTKSTNGEEQNGYQCTQCTKFLKTKQSLQRHEEIHMEGLSFPCKVCEKSCKTRNCLQTHTYKSVKCRSIKNTD